MSDPDQIVSQVRHATREELGRAGCQLSERMRTTFEQGRSVLAEYHVAMAAMAAIGRPHRGGLVIGWFVFEFLAQATLLDWLGDRIDNLTDD